MSWITVPEHLEKEFTFQNFEEALIFVNEVGKLAESMNHHPDISLYSYKHVRLKLTSHDKGHVTDKDRQMADKIEQIHQ